MTTLILQATPFAELIAPKLKAAYAGFLHALDAFAENRMRNAVPEQEFRKAEREIKRVQRMINAGGKSPRRKRTAH